MIDTLIAHFCVRQPIATLHSNYRWMVVLSNKMHETENTCVARLPVYEQLKRRKEEKKHRAHNLSSHTPQLSEIDKKKTSGKNKMNKIKPTNE